MKNLFEVFGTSEKNGGYYWVRFMGRLTVGRMEDGSWSLVGSDDIFYEKGSSGPEIGNVPENQRIEVVQYISEP